MRIVQIIGRGLFVILKLFFSALGAIFWWLINTNTTLTKEGRKHNARLQTEELRRLKLKRARRLDNGDF